MAHNKTVAHLRGHHVLAKDEAIPPCCSDGCTYSRMAEFWGIDRSVDNGTFSNLIDAGGPLTLETIEKAAREIMALPPLPPCGSEQSPHIVGPVAIGEITSCGNCGRRVVMARDNRCVEVAEQRWYKLPSQTVLPPSLETEPPRLPYGLNIIASEAVPPNTMYLVPSLLTDAEQHQARELMKRGVDEVEAVAQVLAPKSAKVEIGDDDG